MGKIRTRNLGILAAFLLLDTLACFCLFPDIFYERLPFLAELAPAATPAPTEIPATASPVSLTLDGSETADEILALSSLPSLREIDATQSREYEALLSLRELLPDCSIRWSCRFDGRSWPSDTRSLTVHSLDGLAELLCYLPALESVDLTGTDASLSDLEQLDAVRPDVFYLWDFEFNGQRIRTDVEVFSTRRDGMHHRFTDEELYPLLKYCRRLKALDLSHNALHDVSQIGEMADLEILILADNYITDATPLRLCTKLTHLELQMNRGIRDFSFLPRLAALRELNVCYDPWCVNLDFLENMPDFAFGMFKFTDVDSDDYSAWADKRPDARLVYWSDDTDSNGNGWRDWPRNRAIRELFADWQAHPVYPGL